MHFGPGLLMKAIAPRTTSLAAFVAAQIVIDFESGYHLLVARDWPVHRAAHTFLLATPIGALAGVTTWVILRLFRTRVAGLSASSESGWWQCLVGGIVGGASHPLLDALIHRDIQPLWPFSLMNPFLGFVNRAEVHELCILAGLAGIGVIAARGVLRQRKTEMM